MGKKKMAAPRPKSELAYWKRKGEADAIKKVRAVAAMEMLRRRALAKPPAGLSERAVAGDTKAGAGVRALANTATINICDDGGKICVTTCCRNVSKHAIVFGLEAAKLDIINTMKMTKEVDGVVADPHRRLRK